MPLRSSLLLIWMSAVGTGGAAFAQASRDSVVPGYDDTRAQHLFGELMSPFCPGLTLATCPSPGADSLRSDIRMRLSHGESPRAIRAAYASTWGEEILGSPRWRGWGVVLWLAPGVLLAAGALALTLWLVRARRRVGGGPAHEDGVAAPALPLDEEAKRRLQEELEAFDRR